MTRSPSEYELERTPEIERQIKIWEELKEGRKQLIHAHKEYLKHIYERNLNLELFAPRLTFPLSAADFTHGVSYCEYQQQSGSLESVSNTTFNHEGIENYFPAVPDTPNWMVPYLKKKRMRFHKEEAIATNKADPTSSTFTLFSQLPMELRTKIWDFCIEPQILDIWSHPYPKSTITTVDNDPAKMIINRSSLARHPKTTIENNSYMGQNRDRDFSVDNGLFVITPLRVPIMQICRESRAFARSRGMIIFNSNKPDIELVAPNITWGYMGQGYQAMRPSKWELFDPVHDVYWLHCSLHAQTRTRGGYRTIYNILDLLGWVKDSIRQIAMVGRVFTMLVSASSGTALGQEAAGAWHWLAQFPDLEEILVVGEKDSSKAGFQTKSRHMRESWEMSQQGLREDGYQCKWMMPKLRYFENREELKNRLFKPYQHEITTVTSRSAETSAMSGPTSRKFVTFQGRLEKSTNFDPSRDLGPGRAFEDAI